MARLLPRAIRPKVSKPEAMGNAGTKLRMQGSLSIPQAADFLGTHKYTVREFIDKGLIDTFAIGSRLRIDEAELVRVKRLINEHGSLAKAWRAQMREQDNAQ